MEEYKRIKNLEVIKKRHIKKNQSWNYLKYTNTKK